MHPPKTWRMQLIPTIRPEEKRRDGRVSFSKPWTSCIQDASESEAAHLASTVSLLRGRDQQLYMDTTTLLRKQHIFLHRSALHITETPVMWSWANAPCIMLGYAAQKGQSLLKVTLLVYRNYSKCAKPKLLKMASFSSPCSPLPWLSC